MVRRKKIIWSLNAIQSRKEIFNYWNERNKSTVYSKKLHLLFLDAIEIIALYPEMSIKTNIPQIRLKLVRDYYIIYTTTLSNELYIIDIWDTRQNPEKFPF